ncbi:hypothetical protein N9948_01645 [bacterium]|nr:hypothetical protein [bacterium]
MKILIACEYSGTVRDAFAKKGHDVWSCDILASETPGNHIQEDLAKVMDNQKWDMIIGHPPCTYLTVTGNRWFYHPEDKDLPVEKRRPHPRFPNRRQDREDGFDFFMMIANANCEKICIENPVGIMSTRWRKPDQIIQPFEFGHPHAKKTCLWLKGLQPLESTEIVEPEYVTYKSGKRMAKWYHDAASLPPHERMKIRSKTFQGIADAMANQWG